MRAAVRRLESPRQPPRLRPLPHALSGFLILCAATGCGLTDEAPIASTAAAVTTYRPEWRFVSSGAASPRGLDMRCVSAPDRLLCYGGATNPPTGTASATPAPTYSLVAGKFTELVPATAAPPGRQGPALAYDRAASQLIAFGGRRRLGVYLQDTWSFDGTRWTEIRPAHAPPARTMAVLAEDPGRGRLVLFGGSTETGTLRDLWEWDGSDWTERSVPAYPAAPKGDWTMRALPVPSRGAVLLYAPRSGEIHWYHDGTFQAVPAASNLPGSSMYGDIGYNPVRGTLEAFAFDGSRLRSYEGRIDTGGAIAWTELSPRPQGTYGLTPSYVSAVAWDETAKASIALDGLRPFELGWVGIANRPPVLSVATTVRGFAEEPLSVTLTASDPDDAADKLVVTAVSLPSGARFDAATRTLTWTPTAAQKGDHPARFTVSDGEVTITRDITLTVLWYDYALLPRGDIDQMTTGDGYGAFDGALDPRLLPGVLLLPSNYEYCRTPALCSYQPFPWPFREPLVVCRFTGKNPGKVVAACTVNIGTTPSQTRTEVVSESGAFGLGNLVDIPGEGPGVTLSRFEYRFSPTSRIVQRGSRTALLRPLPL